VAVDCELWHSRQPLLGIRDMALNNKKPRQVNDQSSQQQINRVLLFLCFPASAGLLLAAAFLLLIQAGKGEERVLLFPSALLLFPSAIPHLIKHKNTPTPIGVQP
jgi:hypothetical protein